MRFYVPLCLALLPWAFANPFVVKRDGATVIDDITNITNYLYALNDSVTAYTDPNDIDAALTIQDRALDLFEAINKTTADVNASQPFNDDDSGTIGIALLNLEPDIFSFLDNLNSKKPTFDASPIPLVEVIILDVEDEKNATDKLGAALYTKLTPDFAALEPDIISDIDQHFNDTIAIYSS